MAKYVVESFDWQIFHNGVTSDGVVGQGGSREKIYLHVIELSETESKRLVPRQDEHGNRESDRLTLFNRRRTTPRSSPAASWATTASRDRAPSATPTSPR